MTLPPAGIRLFALALPLLLGAAPLAPGLAAQPTAAAAPGDGPVIRRTEYGIPHISAADFRGIGIGLGYAQAEDYGVRVIRALLRNKGWMGRTFGRDSLASDFAAQRDLRRVEETYHLLDADTRAMYDGFAEGVNRYIRAHRDALPAWAQPVFHGHDVAAGDIGSANTAAARTLVLRALRRDSARAGGEEDAALATGAARDVAPPPVLRGADADVVREFDLDRKAFVDDGFSLPEAKSRVAWRGRESLFVATDFGPGSLTTSGSPRTVREWTRGTPLPQAELVFEGQPDDMAVGASRDLTPGFERDFLVRQITFWTNEFFLRRGGHLIKIDKPDDANASVHREWLLIELRSPWTVEEATYPAGALLAANFEAFLKGDRTLHVLFEPTDRTSLAAWAGTRNHILLTTLDNVRNRISVLTFTDGTWQRAPLTGVPDIGTATVSPVDEIESDDYWLVTSSPLEPSTLSLGSAATPANAFCAVSISSQTPSR
jgi:hypothetical protein